MSKEIKVALAGVGNCSSSLVQGVEFYRKQKNASGLLHSQIGKFKPSDIRFVAAFDIDDRKVGHDLSEAIFAEPNNVRTIVQPRKLGVKVEMSQPLDGVSPIAGDKIKISKTKPANIRKILEDTEPDVLVNLIPTGASKASEMFAQAALQAECGFINGTPAKVASNKKWRSRYSSRKLPLVGDDIMDQIGSTVLHRNMLSFLGERGLRIRDSYQLDIGGGTESQMSLDKKRYEIKRKIKTAAVAAAVPYQVPIVAGSSDFVDFMENRRTSYFSIDADYFAGTGFTLDMRMTLEDGPACAGALVDVIRMIKVATDTGNLQLTDIVSAYGFKAPPKRLTEQTLKENIAALAKGSKFN
jgi:myo-inositol-1-phosphate synthase